MKRITLQILIALVAFVFSTLSFAQPANLFSKNAVIERLKKDVYLLASDSLEGRESGTIGERLAADYLKERMKEIGLEPVFDGSFLQEFPFMGRVILGEKNSFVVGETNFVTDEDYQVIGQSGIGTAIGKGIYVGYGIDAELGFDDYRETPDLTGKVVFIEYFSPVGYDESKGLRAFETLALRINTASEKGAEAVILVNTNEKMTDPRLSLRSRRGAYDFPLVFANKNILDYLIANPDASISISTDLHQEELTGLNVAGYLDNNSPTTVVIGGHFDHLGYGGASSRTPGEALIHYGADDNASGTAGILEAALFLKNSDFKQNNYLFIAFGAEEKGLIGSRYFVDSEAYELAKMNYMFNYDMIGRVDEGRLSLIGTGSSPIWDTAIDNVDYGTLEITKRPGALGGSDHSSFYAKGIPVLFFFSNTHEDYHRPTDTPDKINYEGMLEALELSFRLIENLESEGKLAHNPSASAPTTRRRTDGVSLGLMPDHAYSGTGLKVLAVIDERPAQRAGLQNGDVIVKLNSVEITDIQNYMEVLNELKAGETATIEIMRDEELMNFEVNL